MLAEQLQRHSNLPWLQRSIKHSAWWRTYQTAGAAPSVGLASRTAAGAAVAAARRSCRVGVHSGWACCGPCLTAEGHRSWLERHVDLYRKSQRVWSMSVLVRSRKMMYNPEEARHRLVALASSGTDLYTRLGAVFKFTALQYCVCCRALHTVGQELEAKVDGSNYRNQRQADGVNEEGD